MKNRTIYEVLNNVMENYSYTIEKEGKKISLTGKVYISKIDVTVTHEKTIYQHGDCNDSYKLENAINTFKEELKNKVADIIKSHAEELTDDEAMIDKLLYDVKKLTEELQKAKEELVSANQRIQQLELEVQLCTAPNTPSTGTTIWDKPNPWSTGITWETFTKVQPDWMKQQNMTCTINDESTSTTHGTGDEIRIDMPEYREKNPKKYG